MHIFERNEDVQGLFNVADSSVLGSSLIDSRLFATVSVKDDSFHLQVKKLIRS